jgi:hypothetical protein
MPQISRKVIRVCDQRFDFCRAVCIWRGSSANSCLQFLDGEVEAAAVVKTGGGSNIYVDLVWSARPSREWVLLVRLRTLTLNRNAITRSGLLSTCLDYLCYFSFILPYLLASGLDSCVAVVFRVYVAMA